MRKLTASEIETYKGYIERATLGTDLILLMQEFGKYQGDDTYRNLLDLASAKLEQLRVANHNKSETGKHNGK